MIEILRSPFRYSALLVSLALLLSFVCCAKTSTNGNSNTNIAQSNSAVETPVSTSNEPSGDQNAASREPGLVSLSAGAFVVKKPQEYSGAYSVLELLDERSKTNWSTPRGNVDLQVIVIALPEKTLLKNLEFDCGDVSSAYAGSCAKDVSVEMSDTNENDGYQKIADVSLKQGADNQKFPVSSEIERRQHGFFLKPTVVVHSGGFLVC